MISRLLIPLGETTFGAYFVHGVSNTNRYQFLSISVGNFGNIRITIACVRANSHANCFANAQPYSYYLLCSQNFDRIMPYECKLYAFEIRLLSNAIIAVCSIYLGNAFAVKRFYFCTPYEFQLYFLCTKNHI